MIVICSRRSLLSTVLVALIVVFGANVSSVSAMEPASDAQFKTQLGKAKLLTPDVMRAEELVVNVSPDGLATSILLGGDLEVSIGPDSNHQSATKVAVIEIPVTVADPKEETFLGYHTLVVGNVRKSEGTRVTISLDLGSARHAVDLPFGKSFDGPIEPEAYFSYSLDELKQVEGRDGERTLVAIPAPPHYTAVIMLSIQRRTADDEAFVSVSGIDVEVIRPRKAPRSDPDQGVDEKAPEKRKN